MSERREEGDTMDGPSGASGGPTPVPIFGRTYYLRGDGDPGYLTELAELVDARMRSVAGTTGTADTLKVAILAALNIADEVLRSRRESSAPGGAGHDERLVRMVALLDEALVG